MKKITEGIKISIDIHDWMYYGDIDDEMVLGTQPKNGTTYAYKFATVNVVERGIRFTQKALPIRDYSEISDCEDAQAIERTRYNSSTEKYRDKEGDRGEQR